MELRQKLMLLKSQNGLTTDALSERSGVPKGTINKLLNGATRNPTAGTLRRLAEALGCPGGNADEPPGGHPRRVPSGGIRPHGASPDGARRARCPSPAGESPSSAASPPAGPSSARRSWRSPTRRTVACDFALRVAGDSMIGARIRDGDLVFIRRQDDVDDGQIAAVIVDDSATLKRVYHVPNGLQLLSENSKYPPMLFTCPDCDSIRILGLAVGFQSRLP